MKSLLEPEFRPGRLNVKEVQLRSALCTSQQVSQIKSSAEFSQWCDTQRLRKQRRKQTGTLLQCVLAISLLLLGYSLAKPQVSSAGYAGAPAFDTVCCLRLWHTPARACLRVQAMLLDVSLPGTDHQALPASHAPAQLISTQPNSQDDSLYNIEIQAARSIIDMAAMETLPATSFAQPEEVFLTEPAGLSIHVPSRLKDHHDLPARAHMNLKTGARELHNVLVSSQYGSYAPDADVDRCDLKAFPHSMLLTFNAVTERKLSLTYVSCRDADEATAEIHGNNSGMESTDALSPHSGSSPVQDQGEVAPPVAGML